MRGGFRFEKKDGEGDLTGSATGSRLGPGAPFASGSGDGGANLVRGRPGEGPQSASKFVGLPLRMDRRTDRGREISRR